jgi:hypothetical protein
LNEATTPGFLHFPDWPASFDGRRHTSPKIEPVDMPFRFRFQRETSAWRKFRYAGLPW